MLALLLCALLFPLTACASETDLRSVLNREQLTALQSAADTLSEGAAFDILENAQAVMRGEKILSADELCEAALTAARSALQNKRGLLTQLFAVILLSALLQRFADAWGGDGRAARLAQWICFLFLALAVTRECTEALGRVRRTVERAAGGMRTICPVLLTLLAAVGGTGSAAVLQPAVSAALAAVTAVCEKICLPLTAAFLALSLLDGITDAWSLSRLSKLCRSCETLALGTVLTAFTGLMSVRGFTAAARDGVALRTAKFAADTFVPDVGGMLSDTAETVAAGSLLVKNALGVTAMALICLFFLAPLVQLTLSGLVFRLCAATAEPVADPGMVKCLDAASGMMGMLAGCLLGVAAMFLILIAQAVAAGGVIAMLA